ncbi:7-cyano-7-deazaguanine reductase [Tahibacter aquaticus]|uniref:NADPH-dependent 7-cyano-7-deazaguanine reductase n=2 Tax=Tahibacter aquaticus TaxID=520092 RepID=A0A4R6Z7P4_9GAMM|nr:7-cyano-7-deazaguanine reductase [Tahibacter aquaticus]
MSECELHRKLPLPACVACHAAQFAVLIGAPPKRSVLDRRRIGAGDCRRYNPAKTRGAGSGDSLPGKRVARRKAAKLRGMNTAEHSSLGKSVAYRDDYDASLLFPIPRQAKRIELGLTADLPFHGVDVWNAYELSWLDLRGKPRVAMAEFRVPATSPNIIESKSFKLYLNTFAQTRMADAAAVADLLQRDLSAAAGAQVTVSLRSGGQVAAQGLAELDGECLDELELDIADYDAPRPDYLVAESAWIAEETLVSHLLKSNCPVTGQPDWASVQVRYRGPRIDRAGLLRYLVSFRRHSDFHEQCVERIFTDLLRCCMPVELSVYARYTRRGGLDINPFRSSAAEWRIDNPRGARQ